MTPPLVYGNVSDETGGRDALPEGFIPLFHEGYQDQLGTGIEPKQEQGFDELPEGFTPIQVNTQPVQQPAPVVQNATPVQEGYDTLPAGFVPVSAPQPTAPKTVTPTPEKPWYRKAYDFADELAGVPRGVAETGAALALGIGGFIGGGLSGLTTLAATGGDAEAARAVEEGVARKIQQFKPVTPLGKDLTSKISPIISAPAEIAKEMVDLPLESWKAPGWVRYPTEKVAEIAPYGAIKPTKTAIKQGVENVVRNAKENVRSLENMVGEEPLPQAMRPVSPEKPVTPVTDRVDQIITESVSANPHDTITALADQFDNISDIQTEGEASVRTPEPVKTLKIETDPATGIARGEIVEPDASSRVAGGTPAIPEIAKVEEVKPEIPVVETAKVETPIPEIDKTETPVPEPSKGGRTGYGKTTLDEAMESTPVYQAVEEIKRQGGIKHDALVKEFGEEEVAQLVKRSPGLVSKEGGARLDAIAADFGFESDGALKDAIMDRQSKRDLAKEERRQFEEMYGDDIKLARQGFAKTPDGVVAGDLKKGDKIFMEDDTFRVIGEDEHGNIILKDGRTITADAFDKIPSDGVKFGERPQPKTISELGDTTGVKNAIVDAERAARGEPPIERPQNKYNAEESHQRAIEDVDAGRVDPRALAKEIAENPRNLSADELHALMYDKTRIRNAHDRVHREIKEAEAKGEAAPEEKLAKRKALEDLYDTNEQATVAAGSEWGQSGKSRQQQIKNDYSLVSMLDKAKKDNGGKPVTPEMRKKLEHYADRIKEITDEIAKHDEGAADRAARRVIERMGREVALEHRKAKRTVKSEVLAAEFDSLVSELNKALGVEKLHAGVDPTAAAILVKMAKNRIQAGINTVAGVVDSIYTSLKEKGIELSKREIRDGISGYGKTRELSQEDIAVQLRELKRLMKLASALEDVKSGKLPERSGLLRDAKTEDVRVAENEVKAAMREMGIESDLRTLEQRWKSASDAIRTRLVNQLNDLTREIATGEKTPKREGIPYDDTMKMLKQWRDELRGIHEEVFGKKEISDEQRVKIATAALEKSINEYRRRIAEQDLFPKKRTSPTPVTPELKVLHDIREELKATLREMQDAARPPKTPEQIALKAFKTRAAKRIAELEDRMQSGDFSTKPRKVAVYDKEGLDLRYKLDQTIKNYNQMRLDNKIANYTRMQKVGATMAETVNTMRAILTSFDLSAVLRQGAFIALGHPTRASKSFPAMFKALMSKKGQFIVEQEIRNRPNYKAYEDSGLYLAEHGKKLSQMEEAYMSHWADKIPGVAASQRAYTTFLNKLRADSFDTMQKNLCNKGKGTPEELHAIANFVNVATGRADFGKMKDGKIVRNNTIENALVGMNTVFFAPRYVISRFQLLTGQPFFKGSAYTKRLVSKEYARFLAGASVVFSLGMMAGGEVEFDPRSADFGKIKFGKTRLDPLGGLSQASVFLGREILGATKNRQRQIVPIRESFVYGKNHPKVPYGKQNAYDVITRFMRSKLSPAVGTAVDVITQKDVVGNKITPASLVGKTLVPLSFGDIFSAMQEQGMPMGLALSILTLFGMGLQTYDSNKHTGVSIR